VLLRAGQAGGVNFLFVVDRRREWPFEIPGSSVVTARTYLTDPAYSNGIDAQVINLCRADRYQGRGYYVSLLAEARGHRPLPDVKTIEDLQSKAHMQRLAGPLDELAQTSLQHDASDLFELDSYFGADPAQLHATLAQQLFALGQAPLLRSHFKRVDGVWKLDSVTAIGLSEVPAQHRAFLLTAATEFVTGQRPRAAGTANEAPKIAILRDPDEADRPSNDEALHKFVAAARAVGLEAEIIGMDALERLPEFDGLFIRTTTNVAHITYEFSRRAAALGLTVIDDPDSILKCTNKVYLNELMNRHGIPTPKTMVVHRDNLDEVVPTLGLPCILKRPDGGFGVGVVKIESAQELVSQAAQLLTGSELLIAQEWLPTEFDWRVCVFDRRALFACKYFMAPGHWQIVKHDMATTVEGDTLALSVGETPQAVINTAVRATNLIGDGLYGVDLKQVGDQCYLIEINDNPNVDAGNEDQVLGDALYREVMGVFARRIGERRGVLSPPSHPRP
jgi:glutathione synthase/RimK-type ligase-like ATP-grasp enzyme